MHAAACLNAKDFVACCLNKL